MQGIMRAAISTGWAAGARREAPRRGARAVVLRGAARAQPAYKIAPFVSIDCFVKRIPNYLIQYQWNFNFEKGSRKRKHTWRMTSSICPQSILLSNFSITGSFIMTKTK